jgi:hypothetical protein
MPPNAPTLALGGGHRPGRAAHGQTSGRLIAQWQPASLASSHGLSATAYGDRPGDAPARSRQRPRRDRSRERRTSSLPQPRELLSAAPNRAGPPPA